MGGLLHLVQRRDAWAGCGPVQSSPRSKNKRLLSQIKMKPWQIEQVTTGHHSWLSVPKIISKCYELMKLCDINCSGPVF